MTSGDTILRAGHLSVDLDDQRVWLGGGLVELGPKPFCLLVTLMRAAQRLVSKEELFDQVWEGRFVSEAVLTTTIRDLRRALGDDARHPTYIETAHGRGYRFMLPLCTKDTDLAAAQPQEPPPLPEVSASSETAPALPTPRRRLWRPFAAVALMFVILACGLWTAERAPAVSPASPEAGIAVLPFEDLSAAGDRAYFADGLAEEILNVLQGVEGLAVVSRTSSFAYRDRTDVTTTAIAHELGVGHVLEGSVRSTETHVRVNVRLIGAEDGRTRWTRTYERALSMRNLLAIQVEIAGAVAAELRDELNASASAQNTNERSAASGTENFEAYELYLHARSLFVTRSDLERSISLAREAVVADPRFAHGWELLAAASFAKSGRPTPEAITATERALQLNANLSLAHALRGVLAQYGAPYDWETSIAELEHAITLDPSNTTAIFWLGLQMHKLGYLDRAQTLLERCVALDSAYDRCRQHLVWVLHARGQTDRAVAHYRTLVRNDAEFNDAVLLLEFIRRRDETAVRHIVNSLEHNEPLPPIVLQALRDPRHTDRIAAQNAMREWLRTSNFNKRKVFSITLALGAYDMVFTGQASTFPLWIPEAPDYRRSEAFHDFVREMNLDDYWRAHGFPPQCRPVGAGDFSCA